MAATNRKLYIKADRSIELTKQEVTLGDVLSMECTDQNIVTRLKAERLLKMPEQRQNRFVFSILMVIEQIHRVYPGLDIENLGETEFIVTYEKQKTPGKAVHFLKTVGVVMITFLGSAFSIMAFNNDVDVGKMFGQVYEQLTGVPSSGFTLLEVCYSVGLIIGILVFFNHFAGKRFSVDPTPMEVEMRLYENDIQTTLVQNYERKKKEIDVK